MTYAITSDCISCDRCLSACPTGAIETNGTNVWIEVDRCNQCEGAYGVPQCWAVCPTNSGCVPLTTGVASVALAASGAPTNDYWTAWFAKYTQMVERLKGTQQSGYWRQWFDDYAQRLQQLQA